MNAIIDQQQPKGWHFTVDHKKPKLQQLLKRRQGTSTTATTRVLLSTQKERLNNVSAYIARAPHTESTPRPFIFAVFMNPASDMKESSSVLAWGANEDGQLGLGDLEDRACACQVDALENESLVSVVAGSRNSLGICEDGRLFTWGWNQRGTLGHAPGSKSECIPSQVKALEKVKIVQAAIGGWHCLAVDVDGCAYAWGGNEYGQCAEPPEQRGDTKVFRRDVVIPRRCAAHLRVRQVAAGGTHSVVCTDDGCVWTWGQPWPPGDIKQISTPVRVQGLENVKLIAVGAFHNLALLEHGEVWAWGNNEYGQLGTGDTQPRALPVAVKGLFGLVMVDVAAGGWHSMALTPNGEVYAWGRGEHGRLGFGDDKTSKMVPQKIEQLAGETIIQVSCGGTHTVALTDDGRMFSFGRADHGRLGYANAVTTGDAVALPIILPQKENGAHAANGTSPLSRQNLNLWSVKYIACGGRHTLARLLYST